MMATKKRRSPSDDSATTTTGSSSSSSSRIVRFNVGGTRYDVSRSLLEQHPDTMLARMVSTTWLQQQEEEQTPETTKKQRLDDDNKTDDDGKADDDGVRKNDGALFIERNGERFQYCLDYMRDGGEVELPPTVSRNGFLQDLVYYGFERIDPSKITVMGSIRMIDASFERLRSFHTEFREELGDLEGQQNEIYMKRECLALAKHCLDFYLKEHRLVNIPFDLYHYGTLPLDPLREWSNDDFYAFHEQFSRGSCHEREFNRCLEKVELKLKDFTVYNRDHSNCGGYKFGAKGRIDLERLE